jgi:hypothetical protein
VINFIIEKNYVELNSLLENLLSKFCSSNPVIPYTCNFKIEKKNHRSDLYLYTIFHLVGKSYNFNGINNLSKEDLSDLGNILIHKLDRISMNFRLKQEVTAYRVLVLKNMNQFSPSSNLKLFTSWSFSLASSFIIFGFNFIEKYNLHDYVIVIIKVSIPSGMNIIPISLCSIQEEYQIGLCPNKQINYQSDPLHYQKKDLIKILKKENVCKEVFDDIKQNFKNDIYLAEGTISE